MKWWVNTVLCDSPDVAIRPVNDDGWLTEVRVRPMRGPSAPPEGEGIILEVDAGGKRLFLQVTQTGSGGIMLWHDAERFTADRLFPNLLRLE